MPTDFNLVLSILLALILISLLGPGKLNIIIALGIIFIPSFARIVRGEVLRCKSLEYVQSAKVMGVSNIRIIFFPFAHSQIIL